MEYLNKEQLEAGLDHILASPKDVGAVDFIVRRPDVEQREVLQEAYLEMDKGLSGDNWITRGSKSMSDGSADPEMQLNIMNSRVTALVAQEKERWSLAGDQLYLDMDLSIENLPPGTQLQIGEAKVEVTPPPHTGCKKFVARFGLEAMKFVNSGLGKKLNLRGINAKVVKSGVVRTGDKVIKLNRS